MRKLETADDIEKALSGLMPVALSERVTEEIEAEIDALAGDEGNDFSGYFRWQAVAGFAAAIALALVVFSLGDKLGAEAGASINPQTEEEIPEMVFLAETDRVEVMADEGLFVDAGGSAVRKVRVRMVANSQIRDEETGIVVQLTEPREELYMVPVSNF